MGFGRIASVLTRSQFVEFLGSVMGVGRIVSVWTLWVLVALLVFGLVKSLQNIQGLDSMGDGLIVIAWTQWVLLAFLGSGLYGCWYNCKCLGSMGVGRIVSV